MVLPLVAAAAAYLKSAVGMQALCSVHTGLDWVCSSECLWTAFFGTKGLTNTKKILLIKK